MTEQLEFYKHIGFEPLGPAVGKPGALFVPMIVTLDQVETKMQRSMKLLERRYQRQASTAAEPISMLPGPVPLAPEEGARLTDFARACKAAARAVMLYPAGHPARPRIFYAGLR